MCVYVPIITVLFFCSCAFFFFWCVCVCVCVVTWVIGSGGPSILRQPRRLEGHSVQSIRLLWLWTSSLRLLSKQRWSFNLPAGDWIIYKVNRDSGCSPVACSSPRLSSRFSFWLVRDGGPFFTGSLKVPSWGRESSRLGRFTRMLEHFTCRYPCDKTAWRPVICSIKKMWGARSCWGRRKLLSGCRICVCRPKILLLPLHQTHTEADVIQHQPTRNEATQMTQIWWILHFKCWSWSLQIICSSFLSHFLYVVHRWRSKRSANQVEVRWQLCISWSTDVSKSI